MERLACGKCGRGAKGIYNCSICKLGVCTRCFLDNLMMCKTCLTRKQGGSGREFSTRL